ncbi:MAG: hypothetical protein KDE22_07900 [Rhodobacterales bacterium]|nr:hypothetical protein [Rhodobacterales bacterium]
MKRLLSVMVLVLGGVGTAWASGPNWETHEQPVDPATLAPAPHPILKAGAAETEKTDTKGSWENRITDVQGTRYTIDSGGRCRITFPELMAEDIHGVCGDGTWTNTVVAESGTLWPLKVGNTKQWRIEGTNSYGKSWKRTDVCTVQGTVRVETTNGTFAAYKVYCDFSWAQRTYYYAPEAGRIVRQIRVTTGGRKTRVSDYIPLE